MAYIMIKNFVLGGDFSMFFDFSTWLGKLRSQYKYTFISAVVFGILSQGMGLFNKFSHHDDAMNLFGAGATYTSGRWMLELLTKLENIIYMDGQYSLPAFNGFLAILFIALAACLVVDLLDIKNTFLCCFIGGLMVCFPTVTAMFHFIFTVHYYMLSMLLSVLAVWLICRHKKWPATLLGILLLCASIGIYQAFLPTALCCFLLFLIRYVSELPQMSNAERHPDNIYKPFLSLVLKIGLSVLLSLALYFIINKLYLNAMGATLSSYKGISEMGKASLAEYFERIYNSYRDFVLPYPLHARTVYPNSVKVIYYICLLAIFVMGLAQLWRIFRKKPVCAVICGALMCLFPLCTGFSTVMVRLGEVHSLMVYSYLFTFIFFAWLADNTHVECAAVSRTFGSLICLICIVLSLAYCRYDNKCYMKTQFSQQQAISFYNILISRIQSVEGYSDELDITFINEKTPSYKLYVPDQFETLWLTGVSDSNAYITSHTWRHFVRNWCGYDPNIVSADAFSVLPEVEAMPSYPDDGSIRIINNTVVVKY